MDWLGLVLGVVKLLGVFTQYLHDRGMIDAGKAEQVASELTRQSDAISKAIKAREAVRGDLALHPDRVRDHDEFERK